MFITQHYICYPPSKRPEIEDIIKDKSESSIWEEDDLVPINDAVKSTSSINSSERSFTTAQQLFRSQNSITV